jgi:hypothetical protein
MEFSIRVICPRNLANMSPCENEGIHEGGGLNFYQLDSILQLQTSVAVSECVSALQLFKQYLGVAGSLNTVAKSYKVKGKRTIFYPPPVLAEAMKKLQEIFDIAVREMPAAQ